MKRKPIINVHCHLFNFDFIPNRMTKILAKIPENIADEKWFSVAAGIMVALIPGGKYNRIQKFLKTYRSKIDVVTKEYIKEMDKAGIDGAIAKKLSAIIVVGLGVTLLAFLRRKKGSLWPFASANSS